MMEVRFLPLELGCPCGSMVERPPRKREDPVRFRARAPGPRRLRARMRAFQARDAGCKSRRGRSGAASWLSNSVRLKSGRTWCDSTAAHRRTLAPLMVTLLVWDEGGM